jgi:glutamate racemase
VRIGIFDSGLGGLAIAMSIMDRLPQYDYIYLGDSKRVPYGNRSQAAIHEFTIQALDYLFAHECLLVIIACNTASAEAVRHSQQEYLPKNFPDRHVLGVLMPSVEAAVEVAGPGPIGVLATASTVDSGSYVRELQKRRPNVDVRQAAAPLLVPLVEAGGLKYARPILADYIDLLGPEPLSALILGCTHYCLLKDLVREITTTPVVSPDEVVPDRLEEYLCRHPEIERQLARRGERVYKVTDLGPGYADLAERLTGRSIPLELTSL